MESQVRKPKLLEQVRQTGGRWNRKEQVWELMYKDVHA